MSESQRKYESALAAINQSVYMCVIFLITFIVVLCVFRSKRDYASVTKKRRLKEVKVSEV